MNPPEFLDLQVVDSHVHFDDTKYAAVMLKVIEGARFHRINLASLISRQKVNSNPESLYFKAKHPKRTYAFGALDYSPLFLGERWGSLDLAAQADTLMKIGFDGVKMVEGKPTSREMVPLRLDGDAYEEFFSKADSSGFPILLHVADRSNEHGRPLPLGPDRTNPEDSAGSPHFLVSLTIDRSAIKTSNHMFLPSSPTQ
ncbi:MAG: hypothetical protein OEW84_07180 [Aigarchaeota archaeon]|nr:hypothetical protein [Aigarchaeota archaeon]